MGSEEYASPFKHLVIMETQLHPILSHYIAWLKAHERLVIIAGVLFFGVHFYTKGFDYLAKHDQTQAQIAHDNAQSALKTLDQSDQTNKLLQQQLADLKQSTAIQYANLQAQIVKRDQQTQQQKQTDNQMTLAQLGARWIYLQGLKPEDVTQSSLPDHLEVSSEAAHVTVNALEDGQSCKLDLQNTQLLLSDSQNLVNRTQQALDGANGEIADARVALKKEQDSHAADVKELKHKNRTAWLHGFKWGAIAGAAFSEAARILLAHQP